MSRKRYRGTSAWIFFTETRFFTKNSLNAQHRGKEPLGTAPYAYLQKKGVVLAAQLTQVAFSGSFLRHPFLLSSPPFFVIYGKVMEALRKHIRLDFLLFFSSLSPTLSEICLYRVTRILRKHYGSPESHFPTKRGRRLPPSSPRRARLLPP